MGWNGTIIDGINTKMSGSATGSIQQALGSSSTSHATLFSLEKSKDDRWARYRPVQSVTDKAGNPIITIHARAGGTINAYGGTATTPGYIGNMRAFSNNTFVTFCGLDIPIVAPGNNQVSDIITNTGKSGYNWAKTVCTLPTEAGTMLRALDFDGYKPTASFPLEYGPTGYNMSASSVALFGGRHADADKEDLYRIFVGDFATYFTNSKMVWALAVKVVKGGTTRYSSVLYTDANSHTFLMSQRVPTYSPQYGYSSILVPKALYEDMSGGTMTVAICGYVPPSSGTGWDGYAFLLPSAGGTTTTNPKTVNLIASSTDPMANLTFNLSAGKWGLNTSTAAGKLVAFPTGMPYPTTTAYGIPTSSTIIFSVTFSNTSGSTVTLTTSSISFRLATYDMATMTQSAWKSFSASAYTWNGSSYASASSTISISNNGSATYYFALSGLWSQLTPESASGYATLVMMELRYGSNTTVYTNNSAYFYATNESRGQMKFSGTIQSNFKLSGLTYSNY